MATFVTLQASSTVPGARGLFRTVRALLTYGTLQIQSYLTVNARGLYVYQLLHHEEQSVFFSTECFARLRTISVISINNINPTVLKPKAPGAYCEVRTQLTRNSCFKKCLLPGFSLRQHLQCTGPQTQRFITAARLNPATRLDVSIMSRDFSHSELILTSLFTLPPLLYTAITTAFYSILFERKRMTANGEVNVKQRRSDGKHRDAEGDDAIVNVNTITEQRDFYDKATHAGAFI